MAEFKRENRYVVIKRSDLKVLTPAEQKILDTLLDVIYIGRIDNFKPPLSCVVVESDWPEYEPTWAAIQKRVDSAWPEDNPMLLALAKKAKEISK
jgi:hypothetical protein